MTKRKILFLSSNSPVSTGSYRIWVKDLSFYFAQLGVSCKIGTEKDIPNYDIIIYSKGSSPKKIPKKIVGLINPEAGMVYNVDFIITGSIEEKDSLSVNKNVFIFPLIEKLFELKQTKVHEDKDVIRLGFHGHYPHLSKFEPNLKLALEEFSKDKKIELLLIHGTPSFNWQYGKPKIKTLFKSWNYNNIVDQLYSCDIGLCPNATPIKDYPLNYSMDRGLYKTDYAIRFKNKSNAGRAFVFHQLGIPVIADLTPSHMHILGNPDNGYIAMSKNGWLEALECLSCHKHRQFIADNARKEFNRLYNPLDWAQKLYTSITKIK